MRELSTPGRERGGTKVSIGGKSVRLKSHKPSKKKKSETVPPRKAINKGVRRIQRESSHKVRLWQLTFKESPSNKKAKGGKRKTGVQQRKRKKT